MSEEMWLASQGPMTMLNCRRELAASRKLGMRSLKRKLRLFAVAQCRLRQHPEMQAECDALVRLAVRQADGLASLAELRNANEQMDLKLDLSHTGFFQGFINWFEDPLPDPAVFLEQWAAVELAYCCSLPDVRMPARE